MSIQWTFIAGYLYFEIAIVIILISPIFGPKYYNYLFQCRLFTTFKEHARVYCLSLLGILSVFLLDSIREMQKYSHLSYTHLPTDLNGSVKLFRAQRNFYITGFSIFLAFVIRRLITMFRNHYELELKAEVIMSKAEDAMRLAKTQMSETKTLLKELKEVAIIHQSCPSIIATSIKEDELVGQGDESETS